MFDLYLPILPSSYLSHSVITTVWIGILVVGFFNLRFGWVLSGLVVPGYLTPLLLIKPLSVGVIVFESIITYFFVYTISEVAARRGLWTNFFGRDRFFALLLTSVGVRLIFDGWALPQLSHYALEHYNLNLDYQDSLHSFGLIIVALIANQFWKPKLLNGLFQLSILVGITYLIIRFVFIEYTNFSLSNIGYLYEDVAGSILASPKSYIILITTAFIASRMNLFYGWDFNGILVPSLLALQWYHPSKIVITFVEAYLIFLLAVLLLKLPIFKNTTIEGARKIMLFFNISFAYKIALSFAITYFYPEEKISDYFAFGYLLSTLMAIKMHSKVNLVLFTRTTLQTSIVSIIIATLLGYLLSILPSAYSDKIPQAHLKPMPLHHSSDSLILYLEKKKVNLYSHAQVRAMHLPSAMELDAFKRALHLIEKDFTHYQYAIQDILKALHYRLSIVEEHYLVLTQDPAFYGWGIYVIDLRSKSDLLIELPYPLESYNMLQSAASIMRATKAKAMAISGVPLKLENRALALEFTNYYTLYHTFHKHYAKEGVVELHALDEKRYQRWLKKEVNSNDSIHSMLFVKGYIPKNLHLQKLNQKLKRLEILWHPTKHASIQKESIYNGFAELYLAPRDRIGLIASYPYPKGYGLHQEASVKAISGLLESWLLDQKIEIAPRASELYEKPQMHYLQFFDHVILTPLLEIMKKWQESVVDEPQLQNELKSIVLAAESMGYSITLYTDTKQTKKYLILHERKKRNRRYWGTYVFGFGHKANIMLQVPRPFYEPRTFEYALELYDQLDARALLISGAHALANNDRSSDVMLFKNKANLFNLVSQVLYRESQKEPMHALQIRAISQNQKDGLDRAVLAFDENMESINDLNRDQKRIYAYLNASMPLSINDGSFESAGYDANALQSLYLSQSLNNTFSTLWLPPAFLRQYRQRYESDSALGVFRVYAVEIVNALLSEQSYALSSQKLKEEILSALINYLDTKDTMEIEKLSLRKDIKMRLLLDSKNRHPYLLILEPNGKALIAVLKLNAQAPYNTRIKTKDENLQEVLKAFYLDSAALLEVGGAL